MNLGRGLNSLLNDSLDISKKVAGFQGVKQIAINLIKENPNQPRTDFDQEKINELAESIAIHGIIQPITVRQINNEVYELVSGERRFIAAKIVGLNEIPAYIRDINDRQSTEMALVENLQRENLNPIEVALSFERMINECNLIQEELGQRVGKNRSTVNNYLRLLLLPEEVQAALISGKITMGHAKPLIALDDKNKIIDILNKIIENGLNVRMVEVLVKDLNTFEGKASPLDLYKEDLRIEEITLKGKTKVPIKIQAKDLKEGNIVLKFNSKEELEDLISKIV